MHMKFKYFIQYVTTIKGSFIRAEGEKGYHKLAY